MLLVIPAINLKNGQCTECITGLSGTESMYRNFSDNPDELCRLMRRENAKSLHITDLDSFENNQDNFDLIAGIVNSVEIPINLLYNFKSIDTCKKFLDIGIYRIFLKDLILTHPDNVKELIKDYRASRISFAFIGIHENTKINDKNVSLDEYMEHVKNAGGQRIIYYDESAANAGKLPSPETLKKITGAGFRVTLYEGVKNPEQLWELNELFTEGIDSVVIGKPIYENNFPCQNIWRLIEAEVEPPKPK